MPRMRASALLVALLSGCASQPDAPPTLSASLAGVWCNSNDGGKTCWAWDEFTERGTLEMCGQMEEDLRPFRATATVTFTDRRMCYEVVASTANFWLRPGQRYCTEIVEVDPHSHVYRDIDTGETFRLLRGTSDRRHCPPVTG